MSEELLEDKPSLLKIITDPKEVFTRVKARPVFLGALIFGTILTFIGMWLSLSEFDIAEIPELAGLTKEEESFYVFLAKVTFVSLGIFGPIVSILMSTVVYFLVAKIIESDVSFKQLFSMNTYIGLITALGVFVNGFLFSLFSGDPEKSITSLGSLVNAKGVFGIMLSNLELFAVWGIILTALGLRKVADFPKGLAWGIAVIFFVVGIILAITGIGTPKAAL